MMHAHRSRQTWIACATLLLAARSARAAPDPAPSDPPPPPGQESGRIDDEDGEDSPGRVAARGVLFVPKLVLDAAMYPVGEAVGAEGTYDFSGWYNKWFTCCNDSVGLVP